MTWWQHIMARLGRERPAPPVEKELQQVTQKIEVTAAAKAQAELAALITGEPAEFASVVDAKSAQLDELAARRVDLLERQRELIAREHGGVR